MKKLILVFSKFLLLSIVIYCLVIIGLYKSNLKIFNANIPNNEHRRYSFTARSLEEFEKVKKTDVLIFGSSLALKNYDSRVFESNDLHSFGLGTSSQRPKMTEVFVRHYLKRTESNIVIIDVNPYLMLMPDTFETVNVIMDSKKNISDIDLFFAEPNLLAFNALIIKYTGFAENNRIEKLKDSVSDKKDKYVGKGFSYSQLVYNEKVKTPPIEIKSLQPLRDQVESLDRIIEFLKSQKINYFLILSPINEDYFQKKSKIKSRQFRDLSKTYFSKYGNYYDSNDLAQYQQTDFMDFSHLNETGAKKFTNSLIPILKKNIKSHTSSNLP